MSDRLKDLQPTEIEKFVQLVIDRESQNATYWFEAFLNSEEKRDRLLLANKRLYHSPFENSCDAHIPVISERFVKSLEGQMVQYDPEEMVYGRPSIIFQVGTGCFTSVNSSHSQYFRWKDMLVAIDCVTQSILNMHGATMVKSRKYGGVYVENSQDVHILEVSCS